MKYLLTAFVLLFVFGACQKEITGEFENTPADTTPTPTSPASLKAKIDGVQWEASISASVIINPYDSNRHFLVLVQGEGPDSTQLGFVLEDFRIGGFELKANVFSTGGYSDTSGETSTTDAPTGITAGTVTVTNIDTVAKTISGEFNFTTYTDSGVAAHVITEGKFVNLPYTLNAGVPPASPTDTFRVNVDSQLFKPYGIIVATATAGVDTALAIGVSDSLDTKGMNIQMPYSITPGSYKFDSLHTVYYLEAGIDTLKPHISSGSLNIVERNTTTKRIRGNFSFTGYTSGSSPDSAKFTQGYFSVIYP